MDLNLFENREKNNNNFVDQFIEELKNFINKKQNNFQKDNIIDEDKLYEKKKIFLDNKSRHGNDLAWITDEKSACISEHGDSGSYFISETDLPQDVKPR